MNNTSPQELYTEQLNTQSQILSGLQKKRTMLGWLRFGVFVTTAAVVYKVFSAFGLIGLAPLIIGIGFLLYLVSVDIANSSKIRNVQTLVKINKEELAALNHQFSDREDGSHFIPAEHAYANDLDIFGKTSIYQFLSRCYTEQGRQLLANNLLAPSPLVKILQRQEVVQEISAKLEWRQQWQAFSMQTTITAETERRLRNWLQEEEKHFINTAWKIIVIIYSCITLGSAIASIAGYIPGTVFSALFLLYLITSIVLSRNTVKAYNQLNGIVKQIAALQNLIKWFEEASFTSSHIVDLQASLKTSAASGASEIKELKNILDQFDIRTSIVGVIFFNPFLLWDVRKMMALNEWRKRNKAILPKWFEVIAEIELLHSLSTLHFNHPTWCFPKFTSQHFTLKGAGIGHPLLPDQQRVNNDFDLQGVAKIGLITGSNMAGKSTFLRSLGVNIVLAQMGSPVCANRFLLSPVQLMSSMRIADNLAENISTFYAELKKLQAIIEAVKTGAPLFILLDEILRGTNSYDRHKGSAALIKQFIKHNAVAVIATHDVELTQLQETYPDAIDNYHFDVEVEGEELYFDYLLKRGVCKSLNASILMKKIGIDLE